MMLIKENKSIFSMNFDGNELLGHFYIIFNQLRKDVLSFLPIVHYAQNAFHYLYHAPYKPCLLTLNKP